MGWCPYCWGPTGLQVPSWWPIPRGSQLGDKEYLQDNYCLWCFLMLPTNSRYQPFTWNPSNSSQEAVWVSLSLRKKLVCSSLFAIFHVVSLKRDDSWSRLVLLIAGGASEQYVSKIYSKHSSVFQNSPYPNNELQTGMIFRLSLGFNILEEI